MVFATCFDGFGTFLMVLRWVSGVSVIKVVDDRLCWPSGLKGSRLKRNIEPQMRQIRCVELSSDYWVVVKRRVKATNRN